MMRLPHAVCAHLTVVSVGLAGGLTGLGCGDDAACAPGESVACVGPGGCSGAQVCRGDGAGFRACDCGGGGADLGVGLDAGNPGDAGVSDDAGQGGATFCGYVEARIRICDGRRTRGWAFYCVDDAEACEAGLRPDINTRDEDPLCYERTENTVYRGGPLPGTCEQYLAYQNGEIECFRDDQCYAPVGKATCVDTQCTCPEGVNCDCGPRAPECDGNVLITYDIDEACNPIPNRFDCAEIGARCDARARDCVEDGHADAGVADTGPLDLGGVDAGRPDAGGGPTPDGGGGPTPLPDAGR